MTITQNLARSYIALSVFSIPKHSTVGFFTSVIT